MHKKQNIMELYSDVIALLLLLLLFEFAQIRLSEISHQVCSLPDAAHLVGMQRGVGMHAFSRLCSAALPKAGEEGRERTEAGESPKVVHVNNHPHLQNLFW